MIKDIFEQKVASYIYVLKQDAEDIIKNQKKGFGNLMKNFLGSKKERVDGTKKGFKVGSEKRLMGLDE